MKKKVVILCGILVLIISIIVSFKTVKISKVDVNNTNSNDKVLASEEILMQVVRGEKEFIDHTSREIFISNLMIEESPTSINQYAFVDIDNDGESELVALTDSYYNYYFVLDIDNSIIYGYDIKLKDMDYISNNGLIFDKDEDINTIYRFKFKNGKAKKKVICRSNDEVLDTYNDTYNEFVKSGLVKYKVLNTNWMEKKLNSEYSIKINKMLETNVDESTYVFALDNTFTNFKSDLLNDLLHIYYMDSNNNMGKINIRNIDQGYEDISNQASNNSSIGIYDENTQYIAIIINNNKFDSELDDNYDIYYFKYFNKGMQFLGKHDDTDFYDLFNEDIISELE